MIFITDVDDVLLDWTDAFDAFVRTTRGYSGVHLSDNPLRLWDCLRINRAEIDSVMADFATSAWFGQLAYYKDANILNEFVQNSKIQDIIAITSCGNSDAIVSARTDNLNRMFPNMFSEIICQDFLESKYCVLERIRLQYQNETIVMLDDNVQDIKVANKLGIHGVVYRTKFHNSTNMLAVDSMAEFLEILGDIIDHE